MKCPPPPPPPPPPVADPAQEMHSVFNMALSFPPSVHPLWIFMSDVLPKAALDLACSVVITALLAQEHPAASDVRPCRLAAPSVSAGLSQRWWRLPGIDSLSLTLWLYLLKPCCSFFQMSVVCEKFLPFNTPPQNIWHIRFIITIRFGCKQKKQSSDMSELLKMIDLLN